MCSMYENIDDRAFVGRKKYYVLMLRLTSLGWDYYLFISFYFFFSFFFFLFFLCFLFFIYTHIQHNASLTYVTSFQLMNPKPVGLRALGVETPLRA